jgi:hypothetical protein
MTIDGNPTGEVCPRPTQIASNSTQTPNASLKRPVLIGFEAGFRPSKMLRAAPEPCIVGLKEYTSGESRADRLTERAERR